MKKRLLSVILSLALIASVGTGLVIARADQENNLDIPCAHEFMVSAVHSGEITFTCTVCQDSYTENFSNHINGANSTLDVNEDGLVNIRDYSILYQSKNA